MKKYSLFSHLVLVFAVFWPTEFIFAAWAGCEQKVAAILKSKRDQFILKENLAIFDKLQLANCDGNLAVNLMVAIHEGVHFIDLNIVRPAQTELKPEAVKLFLTDMTRLPIPKIDLPSPYEIFEVHGKNKAELQKIKKASASEYVEYVLDRDTLASKDVKSGFGTEFNAYIHGTLSSQSLLPLSTLPLITQRTGLIAFIGLTISYFDILKSELPSVWTQVMADPQVVNFYKKLLMQGLDTLSITSHCDSLHYLEINYAQIFIPLIKKDILTVFQISTSPQQIKKLAICE